VLPTVRNRDIFEILFGPSYSEVLQAAGKTEDYPRLALGVEERYWSHWIASPPDHGEIHSGDLCYEAAARALARAGLQADEVSLFVCPNTTPPRPTSSLAAHVGGRLGIRAPCLDLKAGCSSGLYALLSAAQFIAAGAKTVLVAGAETLSKICSPRVPQTAFTVGDGGAALVLRAAPGMRAGMLAGYLDADGAYAHLVTTPGLYPATHEAIDRGDYYLTGDPTGLKEVVPALWPISVQRCLEATRLSASDVDLYIPHQVSLPLMRGSAEALGIPWERTYVNIHRWANVGGSSLLIALAEAIEEGRAPPGATLALNVVGGGLTWAGMILVR
jgi:3-oxoacyl-[acyl-carrier-protein] synthase-3